MIRRIALAAATVALFAITPAKAEWAPEGPVKMMIAFQAGGGADTLGRLLAEELESRYGWTVIPDNVTGQGGVVMARALKDEPNDGSVIGVSVTEATAYAPQAMRNAGYELEDFDYISTITGTQMGIIARADRGWETLADVLEAAKAGETFSMAAMSQRLADATYVLAKRNGIELNMVMTRGGRGSLNAVVAEDVDLGWSAGAQTKAVNAGEIVNLAHAENAPLKMSPDAPSVADFNLPYNFGVRFIVMAPAGMPDDAKQGWIDAVSSILADENSKVSEFANRVFSGVEIVTGDDLTALMQKSYEDNGALLEEASQ